jgi:hypothetical protein
MGVVVWYMLVAEFGGKDILAGSWSGRATWTYLEEKCPPTDESADEDENKMAWGRYVT